MSPNILLELQNELKQILDEGTEPYRKELNKKIHVADVSFYSLQQSAPYLSEKQYKKLIELFKSNLIVETESLEAAVMHIKSLKGSRTRFYQDNEVEAYIIAGSYETLQSNVSKILKDAGNSKEFKGSASLGVFTGTTERGTTTVNIGHISGAPLESTISPLEYQIKDILGALRRTSNVKLQHRIETELSRLYRLHKADAIVSLNRQDIFKSGSHLADLVVAVTIQSADRNNLFSKTEAFLSRKIKSLLNDRRIAELLLNTKGSNTILEDIGERILIAFGKKRTSGSKHSSKPPTKTSSSGGTSSAKVGILNSFKMPQLRSISGRFTSLASLQNLINNQLSETIQKNMGDGTRKDILNYRTGRFANSAKVERMSQSREGMITAFYTYMRNPYGTFSEGGAQGIPKSRDPKLLISKSIREIAATQVANRMRAVLS